jgi:hypothetical protein
MAKSPREVLLVGSVPLPSASAVFETVARHLGKLVSRIPDGEQIGWSSAVVRAVERDEAFEVSRRVPLNAGGRDPIRIFRLKDGYSADKLELGPYGYAANALESYTAFKQSRQRGVIPAATRYQVTLPGPGTSTYFIELPADVLLPLAREALRREIEEIARTIPGKDLAIQLDIAMEAEHEEYLRRPQDFDQPLHGVFHWSLEQMAESVAWLANAIPGEIELGFHICSIWHHDPSAGQENAALVDIANAILRRVTRRVDYVHIPIIPEHGRADMEPFQRLELKSDTKLFLGLINVADGIEGAKRRIADAEQFVSGFGVGSYCGLGRPATATALGPTAHSHPPIPALRRATPKTIGSVLDLHRSVAEL